MLPPLDGIVAANALHFQQDQSPVLSLFFTYLKPTGRMILVEYNIDKGNYAVPYPLPYSASGAVRSASGLCQDAASRHPPQPLLTRNLFGLER